MYRHFSVNPAPASSVNPRLPVALDAVLQLALGKKPEERFPSILDFAGAFAEAASQPVADSEPESLASATPESSQPELEIPLAVISDAEATVQAPTGGRAEQAPHLPEPASASERAGSAQGNIALQQSESSAAAVEPVRERQPPIPAQAAHIEQVVVAVQAQEVPRSEEAAAIIQVQEAPQPVPMLESVWNYDAPTDSEQEVQDEPESALPELSPQPAQLEPVWEYVSPVDSLQETQGESLPEASAWPQSSPTAPVAEHSQTLVSLGNVQQVRVVPVPIAALTWPRQRVRMLALASLLVVLLGVLGSVIYLNASRQHSLSGAQATSTTIAIQLTLTPIARATATSAATPTVAPGKDIAGTYNGHFQERTPGSPSMQLSVHLFQTSGSGVLTGSVSFNGSVQPGYLLQGSVDLQGNFIFTVQQPAGQLPYVFYGQLVPGNILRGNYCRTTAPNCQAATGFFTVGPRYP
jgi:hypothetical protein